MLRVAAVQVELGYLVVLLVLVEVERLILAQHLEILHLQMVDSQLGLVVEEVVDPLLHSLGMDIPQDLADLESSSSHILHKYF